MAVFTLKYSFLVQKVHGANWYDLINQLAVRCPNYTLSKIALFDFVFILPFRVHYRVGFIIYHKEVKTGPRNRGMGIGHWEMSLSLSGGWQQEKQGMDPKQNRRLSSMLTLARMCSMSMAEAQMVRKAISTQGPISRVYIWFSAARFTWTKCND